MTSLKVKRTTAAVVLLLSIVADHAWGDLIYTMTDLGTLPGGVDNMAWDINASGQVVGQAGIPGVVDHALSLQ